MPIALRWAVFALSLGVTLYAGSVAAGIGQSGTWSYLDDIRVALSSFCVFWLAWGAFGGMLGLFALPRPPLARAPALGTAAPTSRTAILMPIYNEDPPTTFARVAAISTRLAERRVHDRFDIFLLSDTTSLEAAAGEAVWLQRLLADCPEPERVFYRRREQNLGRKSGNIEDFISHSGAAYDYAVVLDADSLMDVDALLAMVAQMDESPRLGLLQTLPAILNARTVFGRAIQFASHYYSPVYARGARLLQAAEGPYWGHNAIFRIAAFAQCCGLPELTGKPPFGGPILSHDYVEAALLARAGWEVRLDTEIGRSYEEGPDNIIDFAKRDQRWCQGNLQHLRLLPAPRFRLWNRITLLQGAFSYLLPGVWLVLLIASMLEAATASGRYGPIRLGTAGWALIAVIATLLLLPKVAILVHGALTGRNRAFGGTLRVTASVIGEIVLSTIVAPIILMFQVRAVVRVLAGRDGGWPPSNRGETLVALPRAWAASSWIALSGVLGLALVLFFRPNLAGWTLAVTLPMILAPLVITLSSRPFRSALWRTPSEARPPAVVRLWARITDRWQGTSIPAIAPLSGDRSADVFG